MASQNNKDINKAKTTKDDEFYTLTADIEKEIEHYKTAFADQRVFCNANDGSLSNFSEYFRVNFHNLKLKQLMFLEYTEDGQGLLTRFTRIENNEITAEKFALTGDGGFNTPESLELLSNCDIVVTNPPFSRFREYFELLTKFNKKFLIVGPMTTTTLTYMRHHFINKTIWLGHNIICKFGRPPHLQAKRVQCYWYTNFGTRKINKHLELTTAYDPAIHQILDGTVIVNVDKCKFIPNNYSGLMAVPVNFIEIWPVDQFKLINVLHGTESHIGDRIVFKRWIIQKI